MSKYVIKGGRALSGKISCQSAKNSVLPILAGTILCDDEVVIKSCPKITDVLKMIEILTCLGAKVVFNGDDLIVNCKTLNLVSIPECLTKDIRSSIFLLGPLVARQKYAEVAYPGGCDIGLRPIDLHLKGLKKLGVKTEEVSGKISCRVENLVGNKIHLDFPSVGATENIMLCASLAKGTTLIYNAAKEPEIVDLQNFLNKMGAKISGAGTSLIVIEGVKKLHGVSYSPIGDRIEAGTYLIAAAITGGNVEISNCNAEKISALIDKLFDNNCTIKANNDIINLKSNGVLRAFDIETGPYPAFPTDMQAQMLVLSTVCDGVSLISENVFETRFKHVGELVKMGADITVKDKTAIVKGKDRLVGANVTAYDLRGGAALCLAGLNADGETVVDDICHIERGYFDLDLKMRMLGADFYKIT